MGKTAIKLQIRERHKSIGAGRLSLPSLVVISGKNGSGKTHLLEVLADSTRTEITGIDDKRLNNRKLIRIGDLYPARSDSNQGNAHQWYQQYVSFRRPGNLRGPNPPRLEDSLLGQFGRIVATVMEYSGKSLTNLTEGDFELHCPVDDASSETEPFNQNVEAIFNRYADKKLENELHEFDEQKRGGNRNYLSKEKFIQKYGNPYAELDALLTAANFGYHFNQPERLSAHDRIWNRRQTFELKLIDDRTGTAIKLEDLSSGERIILSLLFAQYNSNKDYSFPDVVLLDEPDAYLHPSMIRQFIDVVREIFVNRGTTVILTTHSPTTVALSPEESLFLMDRVGRWPEKSSKQELLNTLLDGVPSVRVEYDNRRQVFVESKNDGWQYEKLYELVRQYLQAEKALNFISSGTDGSGSRSQVKKIVRTLRGFGSTTVFGIIDWDGENIDDEGVFVLGGGKRDAIENYLFDPLLLGIFLLRERFCSAKDLKLAPATTYLDVKKLKKAQLQGLVDSVVSKISVKVEGNEHPHKELVYTGGLKLRVNQSYLVEDGHLLGNAICDAFPELKGVKNLKNEIIEKILNELPHFVPADILTLFKKIQDG